MNTYKKYCPNVFLAKCEERYNKGETVILTTKYGKENESIVFNLVFAKDGFYYYSIVRADGFNTQEWAKKKAEKLNGYALNAEKRSNEFYKTSNKDKDFLSLGEPIKVGHHSERRHRKAFEDAYNNMGKSVKESEKSEDYKSRAEYWDNKKDTINLSMPESVEFYEYKLEESKEFHEGLKSGKYERSHSFSLTYAKKEVNEFTKKLELAKKLWSQIIEIMNFKENKFY